MTLIFCIASFMFGGFAGIAIMCLCLMAKDSDRNFGIDKEETP